jgi:hypothetical protein
MGDVFTESELNFHFSDNAKWEKFDYSNEAGVIKPSGMKFVDLLIEEPDRLLLVEIKNPNQGKGYPARDEFINKLEKFTDNNLVSDLVEKIRDSYTFLHLMKRAGKPLIYVFLLPDDILSKIHLLTIKEKLFKKIKNEAKEPWKLDYVKDCAVLDVKKWNELFSSYRITNREES